MAAKRLDIYVGTTHLGYTTKVDLTPEISNGILNTFDGGVPDTGTDPTWTLNIDRLRYDDTISKYVEVESLIYSMITNPQNIKIVENVTMASKETAKITEIIYNCTLTEKKPTFDVKTRTTENLGFKGTSKRKWVNDKEIPINV